MTTPESPEFDQARFNELSQESSAAARNSDFLGSRDLCREMLSMNPASNVNRGIALYMLGRIEYLTGSKSYGMQLLEEATVVFPANTNAFKWLCKVYWDNGVRWKTPMVILRALCSFPNMVQEWERQKSMGLNPLVKY